MNWDDGMTIGQYFSEAAAKWPHEDCLIFPDHRHSYQSLHQAAFRRAGSFKAMGVGKGDHVGLLMANCPAYIECLLGLQWLGAVVVPVNARYKAEELAYVIDDAQLSVVMTHDLISEYADFGGLLDAAGALTELESLKYRVMFGTPRVGFMSEAEFDRLADDVSEHQLNDALQGVSDQDPAIMMYTSGTTAHPKGCPMHHEMLVKNGMNMNRSRYFLTEADRFWAPLPMFHMASILPMLCCFDAGAALLSMLHVDAG